MAGLDPISGHQQSLFIRQFECLPYHRNSLRLLVDIFNEIFGRSVVEIGTCYMVDILEKRRKSRGRKKLIIIYFDFE